MVNITYPAWMGPPLDAYYFIREACERFNKEPKLNPKDQPKIYAYGEMHTWPSYIKRLCLSVEKIGAKIQVVSTNKEEKKLNG